MFAETMIAALLQNPKYIDAHTIPALTILAITNGIANNGLNTNGAPYWIGSLILKIAGMIDTLPTAFKRSDLHNRNNTGTIQ